MGCPKVLAHRYTNPVTEALQPEDLPKGRKWERGGVVKLSERFYSAYILANGTAVLTEISPGFLFNFRSGPALVDLVLPKGGAAAPVWTAHDGQYCAATLPRELVDYLMREGLRLEGFGLVARRLGWRFVRWLGGSAYRKDQSALVSVRRVPVAELEKLKISWDN